MEGYNILEKVTADDTWILQYDPEVCYQVFEGNIQVSDSGESVNKKTKVKMCDLSF
jgi:hypothetical protein